jgi:hypothetical protein
MRRREFITLLGGAVAAWPLAARAQPGKRMHRIAFLHLYAENDPEVLTRVGAFRQGLEALGWTENRNIRISIDTPENTPASRKKGQGSHNEGTLSGPSMDDPAACLEKAAPGFDRLSGHERKAIKDFAQLWSFYEGTMPREAPMRLCVQSAR